MAIGALIGLGGSIATNVFGWLNRKEDRKELAIKLAFEEKRLEHEVKEWDAEERLLVLQSQAKVSETESEVLLTTVKGSQAGLIASTENFGIGLKESSTWVKNFITLFRPILTAAFVAITVYASVRGLGTALEMNSIGTDPTGAYDFINGHAALATVYGLTELSVTWWFGDRSIKRVMNATQGSGTNVRGAKGEF